MHNGSYLKGVVVFVGVLLFVGGCENTVEFVNAPPSGLGITKSKCYIWTGGSMTLTGVAEDDDEDPLEFSWTANVGTFTPPAAIGEEITWTAPDTPVPVIVTLKVSDGIDDRTVSATIDVGEEFASLIFGTVEYVDRGYPYIITSNIPVTVSASSNLTIGPGVRLIVDSEFGGLDVRGVLNIEGRPNDRVTVGPNSCAGLTRSWGGIYLAGGSAEATIKNADIYDGKDGIQLIEGARAVIDSCNITDQDEAAVSIVEGSNATVANCKLWDNGEGIFVTNSDFTVRNSTVRYNRSRGITAIVITEEPTTYSQVVEECVIANNGFDGIVLSGEAAPEIHQCSIFFNGPETGEGYALRLANYTERDTVHAESNYWGGTEADFIREQIYDAHDDPDNVKAYVGYIPFLLSQP